MRGRLLALALAIATGLFAMSSPASATVVIDLSITLNSNAPDQPLTGSANFFEGPLVPGIPTPLAPPDPVDIGNVSPGGKFIFSFQPTDPCFGDGSCRLYFSFSGLLDTFPAYGFPPLVDVMTPPASTPIIPIGTLTPTDPCRDNSVPTDPCRAVGSIIAFDAAINAGTWDVTMTDVPEPASAMVLVAALAALLGVRRLRRGQCEPNPVRSRGGRR